MRLTVTADGGAHGSATASCTAFPWDVVAGPVFLLAGAGGLVAVRRRRRAKRAGGGRGGEPVGSGDGAARPPDGEAAGPAAELASSGSGARA